MKNLREDKAKLNTLKVITNMKSFSFDEVKQ